MAGSIHQYIIDQWKASMTLFLRRYKKLTDSKKAKKAYYKAGKKEKYISSVD